MPAVFGGFILFSVVSCMLHVPRSAETGESRLTRCPAYLIMSGHNKKWGEKKEAVLVSSCVAFLEQLG